MSDQPLGSHNGPLRDRIILAIREQGLDHGGSSPHSWRCEHPDRFPGYCDCVESMADAVLKVLAHEPTVQDHTDGSQ